MAGQPNTIQKGEETPDSFPSQCEVVQKIRKMEPEDGIL